MRRAVRFPPFLARAALRPTTHPAAAVLAEEPRARIRRSWRGVR